MVVGMNGGGGGGGNSLQIAVESSGVGEFNSRMDSAVSSLQGFRGAAMKAGGALTAMGAAAGAGIAATVNQARELETSFAEVTTLMDEGANAQATFGDEVRRLSNEFAAQGGEVEVTQGLYSTLSAGITDTEEATQFLETAMKSAKAGLADTQTSVDALSTVVNAYGMEASDAEGVSDVLFETVRRGKTTFPELAGAIGNVVPTAADLGVGIEELGAATATLTAQGQSTDTAMTGINQTLSTLMKPTDAMAGLINNLGYESGRAMVEQEGLSGSLQLLKGAADESGTEMANVFGNVQAMRAALPLAGSAAGEFSGNLEAMEQSAGATDQAFETMANTTDHRLQQAINTMKSSVNALGMEFIKILLPYMETAVGVVSSLASGFSNLDDTSKSLIAKITLVGTVLSTAVGVFLLASSVVPGLAAALGGVLAPLAAIPGALVSVYSAMGLLSGMVTTFASVLYGAFYGALTAASGALLAIPAAASAAFSSMLALPGAALATATAYGSAMVTAVSGAVASLLALPGAAAAAITAKLAATAQAFTLAGAYGAMQSAALLAAGGMRVLTASLLTVAAPLAAIALAAGALYVAYKTNFLGMRDITNTVVSAIKALIRGDFAEVKTIVLDAVQSIRNAWNTHMPPLLSKAREVFNGIRNVVGTVVRYLLNNLIRPTLNAIRDVWKTHGEQLTRETSSTFTSIMDTIRPAINWIRTTFRAFVNFAKSLWNTFGDDIMTIVDFAMSSIVTTIKIAVDGMITAFRIVLAFLSGDFSQAWTLAKQFVGRTLGEITDHVVSWGPKVIGAIWNVLTGIIGKFKDLARRVVGNSIVPDMLSDILSAVTGWHTKVVSKFNEAKNDVIGKFQNLKKRAKSKVSSMLSSIKRKAKGWVSGFTKPFTDAKDDVLGAFRTMKEKAVGNSIVPDMLDDTIRESEGWVDNFVKPFQSAKDGVLNAFDEMKSRSSGISDTVMENISGTNWDNVLELRLGNQSVGTKGLAKSINKQLSAKGVSTRVSASQLENERVSGVDQATSWAKNQIKRRVRKGILPESSLGRFGIPSLDTGGFIEGDGLAQLHAGERVVPAAQVSEMESESSGDTYEVEVYANSRREGREAGRAFTRELRSQL